eukprot:786156-Rhodomonas_salina.2
MMSARHRAKQLQSQRFETRTCAAGSARAGEEVEVGAVVEHGDQEGVARGEGFPGGRLDLIQHALHPARKDLRLLIAGLGGPEHRAHVLELLDPRHRVRAVDVVSAGPTSVWRG